MSQPDLPQAPGPEPQQPADRSRRRIRPALYAAGGAVVVLGGLYVAGLVSEGSGIPEGTTVEGVDLGGLSASQARERLEQERGKAWAAPQPVRIGEETAELDPAEAGLSVDAAATVERANDTSSNPVTVIAGLFGDSDRPVDPVVRVDEARTKDALAALAKKYDREERDGAVAFKAGKPDVTEPRSGIALDTGRSLRTLRSAYPAEEAVRLPVDETKPRVTEAEVTRAVDEFATPAVSGPVTLTVGDSELKLTPATLGRHLSLEADVQGRLTGKLDAEGLLKDPEVSRPLNKAIGAPVNAQLRLDGEKVVVAADGKPGRKVDAKALHAAVFPLLTKTGGARTATVATETVQPELTAQSVKELGIKEQVSTFTVEFPTAPYRTINIGRAAELINGSLVLPGKEWSFNRTVGERTAENGFTDGTMILNGRYYSAPGGGVSAVATTMFNAMFFAGVKPVEYGAHSFYIERYPEGREATVAWGTLDLRWLNDSGHAIYVQATATDHSITITFLGTKKYDEVKSVKGPRTNITEPKKIEGKGDKCEPQTPYEGFDVEVERVLVKDGQEAGRETFRTHYTPRDEITCEPDTPPAPQVDPDPLPSQGS
ncbi:VanW family protein [Streptomyces sp. N35]|uniref:VanW family protein n=1 Tax=Streptomyces sp. N35 TaxID=2795730 RepID=UPI001F1F3957|nr:VanW family protein [Streptomyces sp. N35]